MLLTAGICVGMEIDVPPEVLDATVPEMPAELLTEMFAREDETCTRTYVHRFSESVSELVRLRPSNDEASVSLFSALSESVKMVVPEFLMEMMLPVPEAVGLTHIVASIWGMEIADEAVPVM